MSIGIKGAGFTIGGIAAIWAVNKILNVGERVIKSIADARKWKAYYKYAGNSAYSVPPGYATKIVPHENYDTKYSSPEAQNAEEKEKKNADRKPINVDMKDIGDAIKDVAKTYFESKGIPFGTKEKPVEAKDSVGDTDGDEELKNNVVELFDKNESINEVKVEDLKIDDEEDDE